MSKQRPKDKLERRAEREARQPGSAAPKARRKRQGKAPRKSSGLIGGISGPTLALGLGAILLVGGLIYLVTQASSDPHSGPADFQLAQEDANPSLPGVYFPPHPGVDGIPGTADDREHFAQGVDIPICTQAQIDANQGSNPLCYTSNPPTSGPHGDRPMPFSVLENPAPKENLVHNMEHGGIVVWYNTTDEGIIDQLEDIVQDQINRRRFVVMSQYPGMEPDTVALTGWTRLDKFPIAEFTRERVEDFISEHHKRFNPEGF